MSSTKPMKMKKLNPQGKANRAYEVHEELSKLRVSALLHFYRLGELVREVRDNRYWEILGHDSFDAYLADPDVAIPVSTAYHAIGVVETFPRYKEIEGLTVRNAIAILSPIKQKGAKKERLIEMARSLSASDLQHELVNRQLITTQGGTDRNELPKIYPCNSCGKVKGVFWQDLCHCGLTDDSVKKISKIISIEYDK